MKSFSRKNMNRRKPMDRILLPIIGLICAAIFFNVYAQQVSDSINHSAAMIAHIERN